MTPPNELLIQRIQAAAAASPALQKQLAAVQSTDEAATLLTGVLESPVTAADLKIVNDAALSQMTDAQLEQIAGGGKNTPLIVLGSIFSFGLGCAILSIVGQIKNEPAGGCKDVMSS